MSVANMNSVGYSQTQANMNNTLLTQPKRKKTIAVRNAYNENHATYEQPMKLVVPDEGQVLVTTSMNKLMQDLLHFQSDTAVVWVLLVFHILESVVQENVKNCLICHYIK
jgi:hypothetical protein